MDVPHEDDDLVLRLYAHYFLPANLMYTNYCKLLAEKRKKGKLSLAKRLASRDFQNLWLSTLYVVAEGYKSEAVTKALAPWKKDNLELRVYCSSIEHQMGQLGSELKRFRNATFHYQPNARKHLVFLLVEGRHDPLYWAEDLHEEFEKLFSEYRVSRMAIEMSQSIEKRRVQSG